jgi:hypothetical protein
MSSDKDCSSVKPSSFYNKNLARELFKDCTRTNLFKQNKRKRCVDRFKCQIYFFYITGLDHIELPCHCSSKTKFILQQSNVPLYYILDICYPNGQNSLNTVILYFNNYKIKEKTKQQIKSYLHSHFANNLKIV